MSIRLYNPQIAATQLKIEMFYQKVMQAARENDIDFMFCAYNRQNDINIVFGRGNKPRLHQFYRAIKNKFKL